jgi:hypothetical protein
MKVLDERVSILKKENLFSVVILPGLDKKKLWLILGWLAAWTVCGLIVMFNFFQVSNKEAKLFIVIYLSFWAYFEFNIIRSYRWKKSGKEKLWIQNGILYYQRELNRKGKILEFNTGLVSPIEIVELKPTRFADTINQSFWVKGGERLEFAAQGKFYRFGMQVSDSVARTLCKEINQALV